MGKVPLTMGEGSHDTLTHNILVTHSEHILHSLEHEDTKHKHTTLEVKSKSLEHVHCEVSVGRGRTLNTGAHKGMKHHPETPPRLQEFTLRKHSSTSTVLRGREGHRVNQFTLWPLAVSGRCL